MTHSSNANDDLRFVELLDKWQSGAFTREDERELEFLAAQDPFRREALEGYRELPEPDHGAALDRLRRQLRVRSHRRVVFPQWLAVAASLCLILGAVWFFSSNPVQESRRPVAQELPTRSSLPEQSTEAAAPNRSEGPSEASRAIESESFPPDQEKKKNAGKALSTGPRSDEFTPSDAARSDDLAAINDKEPGYPSEKPSAPEVQSTNVATMREQAEEAGKRSASPAPAKSKAAQTMQPDSTYSPLRPEIGWEQFRNYLNANARLTQEALAHNVTGIVRVQFTLDVSRKPSDFKVLHSLGYGCDEQAERLIKNVRWEGTPGVATTVDVSFVR